PPRAAARAASGMVERTAPPAASRGLHRRRGQPTSGGMHMPGPQVEAKVSQYLNEAQATEQALIQTLQAHIAMTPRGSYREVLEGHLEETREHSRLLAARLGELSSDRGLLDFGIWVAELGVGI